MPECVARLAEPWDEVHLDHDLGGEVYVDVGRDDCGMEVVRWLAREPRRHLRKARFTVHSHNMAAAFEMTLPPPVPGLPGSPPAPSASRRPGPRSSRRR